MKNSNFMSQVSWLIFLFFLFSCNSLSESQMLYLGFLFILHPGFQMPSFALRSHSGMSDIMHVITKSKSIGYGTFQNARLVVLKYIPLSLVNRMSQYSQLKHAILGDASICKYIGCFLSSRYVYCSLHCSFLVGPASCSRLPPR